MPNRRQLGSVFLAQSIRLVLIFILLNPPGFVRSDVWSVSAQTPANAINAERERAIELIKQKQFPAASQILKRVVDQNKTDADAWYFLGVALMQHVKEFKNSSKAFETALRLRPNFAPAHAGLAYSLMLREKLRESLGQASKAIDIDPTLTDAHFVKGVDLLRLGNPEEALKEANETIRLDPQLPSPYLLKSQAIISSLAIPPLLREKPGHEARINSYREAADALEKYLQLNNRSEEKEAWGDQLEALRFYVSFFGKKESEREALEASQVTTKVRILSKPEPRYTEEARQRGVIGTVILRAVFGADGSVKHILVLKALPNGLTQKSVAAARLIKFEPATQNGRPVSMFLQLEYNFNLY